MKRLGQNVEEDAIDRWDDRWLREKLDHHKAVVAYQKGELRCLPPRAIQNLAAWSAAVTSMAKALLEAAFADLNSKLVDDRATAAGQASVRGTIARPGKPDTRTSVQLDTRVPYYNKFNLVPTVPTCKVLNFYIT